MFVRRHRALLSCALAACTALLLAACDSSSGADADRAAPSRHTASSPHSSAADPPRSPSAPRSSPACTNRARLARWPDRRLAMLTITVPVSESRPGAVTAQVEAGAGGVLLFGTRAPADLDERLAALRSHVPDRLGLLVMSDEEGGGVQRMPNLTGSLPWAARMGEHWSPERIRRESARVGRRLAAAGVTMDLAPVLDVDGSDVVPGRENPDGLRSFSGSTDVVARAGTAAMAGLRDGGVVPVVKHFPGIGGSSRNTDFGPGRTLPWPELRRKALPPFTAAVEAGAPAVMVSHNSVPGHATGPASLSRTVITGDLRGALGFDGLVLTDTLTAKAVSAAGFSTPHAAVLALRAGADMVMFGLVKDVPGRTAAIASAIESAVADGTLPRGRLVDAAAHILGVRHVELCGKR